MLVEPNVAFGMHVGDFLQPDLCIVRRLHRRQLSVQDRTDTLDTLILVASVTHRAMTRSTEQQRSVSTAVTSRGA